MNPTTPPLSPQATSLSVASTPAEFCFWLKGQLDVAETGTSNSGQRVDLHKVRKRLHEVFQYEITNEATQPPSQPEDSPKTPQKPLEMIPENNLSCKSLGAYCTYPHCTTSCRQGTAKVWQEAQAKGRLEGERNGK